MQQALIVDDNEFNTNILAQFLDEEGLSSIIVTSSKDLDKSFVNLDDLKVVFLDLEMPQLDGFEVLAQLREVPLFEGVPIIAHSVHISEIKVAHEAGFNGFIGKPVNADKFSQQLSRILSGKGVWETA